MLNIYPQGPDGAEQGQFLATRRGGKRSDLGSERSGEHLRYITKPWIQDDLGVVKRPRLRRRPGATGSSRKAGALREEVSHRLRQLQSLCEAFSKALHSWSKQAASRNRSVEEGNFAFHPIAVGGQRCAATDSSRGGRCSYPFSSAPSTDVRATEAEGRMGGVPQYRKLV